MEQTVRECVIVSLASTLCHLRQEIDACRNELGRTEAGLQRVRTYDQLIRIAGTLRGFTIIAQSLADSPQGILRDIQGLTNDADQLLALGGFVMPAYLG